VEVIEVESRHQLNAAVRAQLIAEKLKSAAYPRSARYDVQQQVAQASAATPGRTQNV
jgi:ribosomal protein S3